MARRGFLADIQHQARLNEQRNIAWEKQRQAAVQRELTAQRTAERAQLAANRASEADRKRLTREAGTANAEARQAEVDRLNAGLVNTYTEIDGILLATLAVDDFVDLEKLRAHAAHPPFPREDLRVPVPVPVQIPDPPLPVRREPAPPTGLFGKKKKLAEAQGVVEAQYAYDYHLWQQSSQMVPALRAEQLSQHAAAEATRAEALAKAVAQYDSESALRENTAAEQNTVLDELIAGLGYGTVEAVQEYVAIVLANSVYPDSFPVKHTATFDPESAELKLKVLIPGPERIPTIKAYRYTKSTDAITPALLAQKDQKDRYAGAVYSVALRSLHEVFEADRRGLIGGISLELGTETINPATGRETYIPFVAVAAAREQFLQLDLSEVTPMATLEYLGAAVSKNPLALSPANGSGVRRAK